MTTTQTPVNLCSAPARTPRIFARSSAAIVAVEKRRALLMV
jgi:hypothetical protein